MLTLLITTGLRRGECVGLQWRDIDEQGLLLRVQRNVIYTAKTGIVVNTPKTAKSRRSVPIMESTLRLLLLLKQQRRRECPGMAIEDSFIFPGEKGIYDPKDPNAVTAVSSDLCQLTVCQTYLPTTSATVVLPCYYPAVRISKAFRKS